MENRQENQINSYTNMAKISGVFEENFTFSHETQYGKFFGNRIIVKRKSGAIDYIPIMIPKKLVPQTEVAGKYVELEGEMRSSMPDRHLRIYVFPKQLHICDSSTELKMGENYNKVIIEGTIRKSTFRETPFGRIISDCMISVKRNIGIPKYDYLPCIAWGSIAVTVSEMEKGDAISFVGRFQSRPYEKNVNGVLEQRIAYEISIMKLIDE